MTNTGSGGSNGRFLGIESSRSGLHLVLLSALVYTTDTSIFMWGGVFIHGRPGHSFTDLTSTSDLFDLFSFLGTLKCRVFKCFSLSVNCFTCSTEEHNTIFKILDETHLFLLQSIHSTELFLWAMSMYE